MRQKVAIFPRFLAKNVANLAIFWCQIGDFWQKTSGNTEANRQEKPKKEISSDNKKKRNSEVFRWTLTWRLIQEDKRCSSWQLIHVLICFQQSKKCRILQSSRLCQIQASVRWSLCWRQEVDGLLLIFSQQSKSCRIQAWMNLKN